MGGERKIALWCGRHNEIYEREQAGVVRCHIFKSTILLGGLNAFAQSKEMTSVLEGSVARDEINACPLMSASAGLPTPGCPA